MEKFTLIVTAAVVLLCLPGMSTGAGDARDEVRLEACYQAYIDRCISKCTAKMQLDASRSKTLRRAAALATMKQAFLVQYRDALILRMKENNIPAKQYRVNYYLDRMFYGLFHSGLAMYRW